VHRSNEEALTRSKLIVALKAAHRKKGIQRLVANGCRKTNRRATGSKLAAIGAIVLLALAAFGQDRSQSQESPQIRLGLKLFKDARFSSPQGDLRNSCSSCHLYDEDPQGMRAHTDFFSRSWVPWRSGDPRRDELRNSPTILDAAMMPRLHFDGEFASLEDLVKGTLSGRPMGWLPGEQDQAFDRVREIILKDTGSEDSYRAEFKAAFGDDLGTLTRRDVIDRVAKAIATYMRTLKTSRATAYDRFIEANGLDRSSAQDEEPKAFGRRLLNKVAALERRRELKLPRGFDPAALRGLKVFFRTSGNVASGNCVACHAPPLFTDFSFHNMGISQSEYDRVNGEGGFAELKIPAAAQVQRPSSQFRETPSKQKPGCADLGYWNFVDLESSSLRRSRETDERFLQRMIATFKTPTLRDLAYTYPYMHTGGFTTVEDTLEELMRLSEMARQGRIREGDEELPRIRITEVDIPALAAFLRTLNEDLKPGGKY
jgi:cytochrome c peroxidase